MKSTILMVPLLVLFSLACDERIIEYRVDERYFNDAFHGDLVGRVLQKQSGAVVIVNQVNPVDSTVINPNDGSFVIQDLQMGNYDLTIRADNYRIYTRSNIIIEGGGITYAGEIDLSTVPDLVAQHYPENSSEVVYDWRYGRITISILFTRPMDRLSVEKAFSTEPRSEGVFYWGQFTQAPQRTLFATENDKGFEPGATITTFSKVTSMAYSMSGKDSFVDTTYTVRLTTEAHDTSGNYLRFPLVFSFRTVQSYTTIYGIQTSPVHGDINVELLNYGGIRLTFPRRMDPASTETATTITPVMNKVFLWPEGNVMVVYTGGPYLSDTTITLRIDGSARDRDGIPMGEAFSFWFRTAPLSVSYTSPENAQLFVAPTQQIFLNFNSYVIRSTVQSAFSITPSVGGTFSFGGTNTEIPSQIVFTPYGSLQANTKYTVTISTAAKDLYGVPMKEPYSFSFVTRPN
jgi:hypothetical protein